MSHHTPAHTMIFLNYNFILGVTITKVYKNELPLFWIAFGTVISGTSFLPSITKIILSLVIFSIFFNASNKDVFHIFGGIGF
jgi:hypothetical protein